MRVLRVHAIKGESQQIRSPNLQMPPAEIESTSPISEL
jgi:hypothetical protein